MTFQSKRAWRLQEFAAHGGNVNCLALGPKKARLMATGGEDRKVCYKIVNCILLNLLIMSQLSSFQV